MRLPSGATAAPWFDLDAVDHADDFVGRRIDDVHVVAGAVGLDDPDLCSPPRRDGSVNSRTAAGTPAQNGTNTGESCASRISSCNRGLANVGTWCPSTKAFKVCHSGSSCESSACRRCEKIAARLLGQRVDEQFALQVAGRGHALNRLEVLSRFFFVPGRAAGCERLQPQRRAARVAGDAARMTRPLGEKDRLHLGLEELEVKRSRGGGRSARLLAEQAGE